MKMGANPQGLTNVLAKTLHHIRSTKHNSNNGNIHPSVFHTPGWFASERMSSDKMSSWHPLGPWLLAV